MRFAARLHLLVLFALTCFLPACGPGNAIRLLPPPAVGQSAPPTPNMPRVTVVRFEDKRHDKNAIGQRRDNSAFTSQDSVTTWVSRTLADELARHGMQISYATSTSQAIQGNPDFLVLGEIGEIWLRENSATDLSLSMSVHYAVHNRQKRIRREAINNTLSHSGLPSSSAAEKLMQDGVRDLARDMAKKLDSIIKGRK